MSKVDLRRLDSLSHNDTAATKTINDNFQALKEAVEDSLSRTGKTPNYMDAELDMNSRRIINGGAPVEDGDYVTLKFFKDEVGNAKEYANQAKASADLAESHALNAAIANKNAQNSATLAEQSYQGCRTIYEEIKNIDSVSFVFREVEFSPRQIDTVYEGYPYSYEDTLCDVSDLGIELADGLEQGKDIFPTVTFSVEQVESGMFAPVADVVWLRAVVPGSQTNTDVDIRIYSKEPITESFTIPTIKLDVVQWL